MELKEKDIEKLDFILGKMIETDWLVISNDLHVKGLYSDSMDDKEKTYDFKYLLSFFDETNSGQTSYEEDNIHVKPNEKTVVFYKNGGFKKYFSDLKALSQKQMLEDEKEIERQKLKDRIDEFKLDELEYKKTIRGLEEQLKISSLFRNWWWLIACAVGLGVTMGKWLV